MIRKVQPSDSIRYPIRNHQTFFVVEEFFERRLYSRKPAGECFAGHGIQRPHFEQLEEFERRGFVVVPSLFSREETTMILGAVRDAPRSMPSSDPRLVLEPDSDAMRSICAYE